MNMIKPGFYNIHLLNCLNHDYPDLPDDHDFSLNSIEKFWFRYRQHDVCVDNAL